MLNDYLIHKTRLFRAGLENFRRRDGEYVLIYPLRIFVYGLAFPSELNSERTIFAKENGCGLNNVVVNPDVYKAIIVIVE